MDNLKKEAVNSPSHYNAGGIECIDAIRAALTPEEFRGFCKGNVLKYTWREGSKNGNEDMRKAGKYNEYLLAAPAPAPALPAKWRETIHGVGAIDGIKEVVQFIKKEMEGRAARDMAIAEAVQNWCIKEAMNAPNMPTFCSIMGMRDLSAIIASVKA